MAGWFRGVGYRLLPVLTGVAFITFEPRPALAAEISLSDLHGYSIEAEWIMYKRVTDSGKYGQGKPYNYSNRVVDQIYISKTGRSFHRQRGYTRSSGAKPAWGGEFVRSRGSERLRWGSNSTLVKTSIPSDDKKRTTYVRITRIAFSQSDGSYSCSVKTSLALQKGEKQYKQYEPSGRYDIIHSFKAKQKSCRVFKGNVFKGEVGP